LRAFADQAAVAIALVRTTEHLGALLEINRAIIAATSQDALLGTIVEPLKKAISFEWAALNLPEPELKEFA